MRLVRRLISLDAKRLIGAVLLIGLAGCPMRSADRHPELPGSPVIGSHGFPRELQIALNDRLRLVEQLGVQAPVVAVVRQANQRRASLSECEIALIEKRWWQASVQDRFIKSLMMNSCAERLFDFQDRHLGFPEIFVTDASGLIVAQTNKTSDYIQSDEIWWQLAHSDGWGRSSFGELVYDESAYSESISINVPVLDPDSGRSIGVLKAVCDITDIKLGL